MRAHRGDVSARVTSQVAAADRAESRMGPGPVGPDSVTPTQAMSRLGCNRDQLLRLIQAGLLPELGRRGRTRLLDPVVVEALARRPVLPDAPGDQPDAPIYALALHVAPRTREPRPDLYRRHVYGFHADGRTRDNAWLGWWNTGEQVARYCVAQTLPVLPAVSGIIVDVRVIVGYVLHPASPGLVRFDVAAAPETVRARFTGTRLRPAAGPPWQRLRSPARAGLEVGPATALDRRVR